jgi:hypothetical protein
VTSTPAELKFGIAVHPFMYPRPFCRRRRFLEQDAARHLRPSELAAMQLFRISLAKNPTSQPHFCNRRDGIFRSGKTEKLR